jgi:HD-like signal output (HDOD) protein
MGLRYEARITREFTDIAEANQAEERLFGMDHCEAGAIVARKWGFPAILHDCMSSHHKDHPEQPLALVQMACRMADSLGFSEVNWREQPPPFELPDRLQNRAELATDHVREQISRQIAAMGG